MADASPFHEGERRVQQRVGVRAIEDFARQAVRPWLPDQHRAFYAQLPFVVAAARDAGGRPWATLLWGDPGFVQSPDPKSLRIDARPATGDALADAFSPGADVGLLGIELATRRRNRVNGRVASDRVLLLDVDQSFGNCPQYITERDWVRVDDRPGTPRAGTGLSVAQQRWVATADTFFIATGHRGEGEHESFGMDASHRGGAPGFVRVDGAGRIVFPDYAGNRHFNTIGNLEVDPRVGLLFVDFDRGSLLQITGRATVVFDGPDVDRFAGAERIVVVDVDRVIELSGAIGLRWRERSAARALRVAGKQVESREVTSLWLEAADGKPLAPFAAGQHLPIEVEMGGKRVRRTYSISNSPGDDRYRISVKRESHGVVSRHLHEALDPGATLYATTPAGEFVLPEDDRPLVLASAGVGVTPMISMLHALVEARDSRPVWFVHGARDGQHHPLRDEVRDLVRRHADARLHVAYSRPRDGDVLGRDYDYAGRVDASLLVQIVGRTDAHHLLCGPIAFMSEIQTGLEAAGAPPDRIHRESFGVAQMPTSVA